MFISQLAGRTSSNSLWNVSHSSSAELSDACMLCYSNTNPTYANFPLSLLLMTACFTCAFNQWPGKVIGILKSSDNRDDVELLVAEAKVEHVPDPSPAAHGKTMKVGVHAFIS